MDDARKDTGALGTIAEIGGGIGSGKCHQTPGDH